MTIRKRMASQPKEQIMWIDLTVSVKQSEMPSQFSQFFDIVRPHAGSSLESEIRRQDPLLLLFDFDYPERPGLKLLEITKKHFPSVPILMSTTQHSESLVVGPFVRAYGTSSSSRPPNTIASDVSLRCTSW